MVYYFLTQKQKHLNKKENGNRPLQHKIKIPTKQHHETPQKKPIISSVF